LAGGILAGVIGPQLVILTKDAWPPYLFAATYLAQSICAVLAGIPLTFLKIPKLAAARRFAGGRPLSEIVREPRFIVALACGLASYSMMNLVMTSAPLAMVMCYYSVGQAALGIQWHVIAMYGPSFFTGPLILRFGLRTMMATGLLLIAAAVGYAGIGLWNISGCRLCCSASAGISPSSAPPRWSPNAMARWSATRCRRSMIF
jgi:hypothetical protein